MYKRRKPTQSERKFFKANPKVQGMMSQDSNQVVLRPKKMSTLSPQERKGVAKNEKFRLFIRETKPKLNFELTDEQIKNLSNTDYGKAGNEYQAKATILARHATNDKSGGKATEEQKSALKTIMADYKQAKKKFRKESKE